MERYEMMNMLEEYTRLENFFGARFASAGTVTSYCFGKNIDLDCPEDIPEDVMRPSHEFLWNTDRTSLAYLGNVNYKRFRFEEKGPLGTDGKIALLKMPRYLNLIDISNDFVGIVYVFRGNRKMKIDGRDVFLKAGNAVVFMPYTRYSTEFIDPNNITVHILIRKSVFVEQFSRVFSGVGILADFLSGSVFWGCGAKYLVIDAQPDERLRDLVIDMLIEQEKQRDLSEKIIACGIELFLCLLASDYESSITAGYSMTGADRTALSIMSYMRENYANISLEDIARHFFLSSSYISRVLKRKFGGGYIRLLTDIRMRKAAELLTVRNLSVETVAGLVGYGDPRQFRRVFKSVYGVSPNEYIAAES